MKSEGSTPTKRLTAASFIIPTSTSTPSHSVIPADANINVLSCSVSESIFKPKKSEVKSKSNLHPSPSITLSEGLKREFVHRTTPASRPNSIPASGWSPGFFRKLLWRARRYTMWDGLVFCSFAVATTVFLSALFGVGYSPEEPVLQVARFASTRRASEPGVIAHDRARGTSASDMLEDFLKFSGFGPGEVVKIAEEVYFEESEQDDVSEPMSPLASVGRRGHEPPPFGGWHQRRRRMITKYEPSIYPPHEDQAGRRRTRLPWVEPPPPSPFHGPFHKRLSELSTPSGVADHNSGSDDDQGEPLWGLDEDDHMEDSSSEEDTENQEA